MTLAQAFDTLRRVRTEFDAGRFALGRVLAEWDDDPPLHEAAVRTGVTFAELERCHDNLEFTFVLRLFAEFEAILREYWVNGMRRTTEPPMRDLIDAIGARRGISEEDRDLAHDVRTFRNEIIHEGQRDARLTFVDCLRALGRFLRWLPQEW